MPYGDSITEGYPIWGGYRIELFRLANRDDHAITFVGSASNGPDAVDGVTFPKNHEGHGGYTIQDVPARNANGIFPFAEPSIQAYKPDIILLMVGTNDINGNMDVATAPNRLGQLLDEIYSVDSDVFVVLAQIVPSQTDGTNQAISNYNAAIPALVSERSGRGDHIALVDMYGAFTSNPNYKQAWLGDNLHPNEAGYAKMAEVWYSAIEGMLR
jgi:lysophospholipase L1-like esterase